MNLDNHISSHFLECKYSLFKSHKVHIIWEGNKILRNLHRNLTTVHTVKSKVEFLKIFEGFSEYMNFNWTLTHHNWSCKTRFCLAFGTRTRSYPWCSKGSWIYTCELTVLRLNTVIQNEEFHAETIREDQDFLPCILFEDVSNKNDLF